MWQSFQPLPIYIFEHHKIIKSSVMHKIFSEIFFRSTHFIKFDVAKLIKTNEKRKQINKNINV